MPESGIHCASAEADAGEEPWGFWPLHSRAQVLAGTSVATMAKAEGRRRAPKGRTPPPENSERSSVQVGSTTSALQTTTYVPGGLALQDGAKVLMEGTCFNHALQTCCRAHPRELATGGLPRRTWLSSSGSSPTTSRPRSLPKPETALLKQWRDRVYSSKK